MKAHAALPRFREGSPFRPWLLAIVANEARTECQQSVVERHDEQEREQHLNAGKRYAQLTEQLLKVAIEPLCSVSLRPVSSRFEASMPVNSM